MALWLNFQNFSAVNLANYNNIKKKFVINQQSFCLSIYKLFIMLYNKYESINLKRGE